MAPSVDYQRLFETSPGMLLVIGVDDEFTILAANDAYLQATMTRRELIVGKPLFEVFPENPGEPAAAGESNLRASLKRAIATGQADRMPTLRYDIRRPEAEGGGFEERHWSPVNTPTLSSTGQVLFIQNRVEDVTPRVRRDRELKLELARARVALFRDIFETVSDVSLFVGHTELGEVLLALNPAAERFLGRATETVVGLPIDKVLRGPAGERILAAVQGAMNDGAAIEINDVVMDVDGPHTRRVSIRPISLQPGGHADALVVIHDVTAERLAIEATRTSEARLRTVIDLVPVSINVRDLDGRFLLVNKQVAAGLGLTVEQATGLSILDLADRIENVAGIMADDRRVIEGGKPVENTGQRTVIQGEERFFHSFQVPYPTASGEPPAVLSAAVEVTEIKRATEALRLSEERYRTQFDHAPEVILTLDVALGEFVEANEKAIETFGYSHDELRAGGLLALSAPTQASGVAAELALREHLASALAGGRPVFEWICRDRKGREVPFEVRLVRLPGPRSLVRGSLIDISARKQAEEERRRIADLELQVSRIREANRLKSEFLANMSHELRTPLNAVIGFATLLHDGHVARDSPEHDEFLGDIVASGRHLLQLINDVLDLAKVESGKLELHRELVHPGDLTAEVLSVLRSMSIEKRIRTTLDVDPTLGRARLDAGRFKQVVYNYLSNALKFTGESGHVRVSVQAEGATDFRLSVEDDGIGIAAKDLPLLFMEFQQVDQGSAKRHPGTGLGLALTKRLVEAQGGTVGVTSVLGRGSTFHAVLPRDVGPGLAEESPPSLESTAGSTVLVVEDTATDRSYMVEVLRAAGYAVESVPNGSQALTRVAEKRFDAITLDLILPDMSGLDLLARIRAAGPNARSPIIVATVVSEAHLITGFAVHDVLHKPFTPEALLGALRRAGVTPPASGSVLVVDDDVPSLKLMEATLRRLGYEATGHTSGHDALAAARAAPPAAVILDLLMPEMDGFAFLHTFRLEERHRLVPVIVWSQKELSLDERELLRDSVQAVLRKTGDGARSLLDELAVYLPAKHYGE